MRQPTFLAPVPAEQEKQRALRRMKLVALAFLGGATLIFLATTIWLSHGGPGWVGYLKAAAEAGMVGGVADWFAVTALFRRPLGLPIPHTAIIPTKKDALGQSLGDFVGANFLSEDVVRERLKRVGVSAKLGGWLAQRENAERVTAEVSTVMGALMTVLRDDEVQAVIEQAVVKRIVGVPWGPPLGKLLERVFADGTHYKMVDLMAEQAYEWVQANRDQIVNLVSGRAPVWSPRFVDSLVGDKIYNELLDFTQAVRADINHPMRLALDRFLQEFAHNLRHDPATMARAESLKQQVLEHPEVQTLIGSIWGTAKRMLLEAAGDPASELRTRVRAGLMTLGDKLAHDDSVRAKADGWVEGAAAYVVLNYRHEITVLISDTIARWDGEETARKVELQVGRDLQFIRINGTVVGAAVGLVIYAVAQLIG